MRASGRDNCTCSAASTSAGRIPPAQVGQLKQLSGSQTQASTLATMVAAQLTIHTAVQRGIMRVLASTSAVIGFCGLLSTPIVHAQDNNGEVSRARQARHWARMI